MEREWNVPITAFEDGMIHSLGNPPSPIVLNAPKRRSALSDPACEKE